jgi:hypothetical protein
MTWVLSLLNLEFSAMKHVPFVGRFILFQATSICVLVLTAYPVQAAEQDAAAAKPESAHSRASADAPAGRKLFYATHSLMWDVPAPLTEEVTAFGIKDHDIVGVQRLGFSRTQQHWDQPEGRNQAKTALQDGKVDDFIMSPMDMPDKGVENFVMLGVQNNPSMRFFVQNNWAGFNNDGQKARQSMQLMTSGKLKKWDESTEEDLKTLNTQCEKAFEAQVKEINEKLGREAVFIIPTSQANTALRTAIVRGEFPGLEKQSQLFLDQIGHPTPPLVALNTYLHFATIYGRSPVGLPIPTVLKRENNPKFDEDFNRRLQELAWKTVTEYAPSGVKAK